jgi:deazaflavin-dependent oxidoreductase (nitroreductase family)
MPPKIVFTAMNRAHRVLHAVSGGRAGWVAKGMPILELTTTGRKTGQPRSVMLAAPIHHGDTYVVVASAGGNDQPPAWFLNLQARPEVEVRRGRTMRPMRARVASSAERDTWWARITADYPHYAGYQRRTGRVIPLVELSAVEGHA